MDDLLQQGIAAYRAGKRDEAREIFIAFIKQNPESERGWGWMYDTSDNDKARAYCLRQMLRINPNNKKARQLLSQLPSYKPKSTSGGLKSNIALLISVAFVCLVGVCCVGFLFFENDNKITSTTETPILAEPTLIVVPQSTSGGSGSGCCKVCGDNSKACGDSCISNNYSCSKPRGCACDG